MNRKQRFLKAVRILAPGDQFVLRAARKVPESRLPAFPGGVALELVAMFQRLKRLGGCAGDGARSRRRRGDGMPRTECRSRATLQHHHEITGVVESPSGNLKLGDALRVKAAEYWLKLGQPAQAVLELRGIAEELRRHPWVLRVSLSAMRAIRENHEALIQE